MRYKKPTLISKNKMLITSPAYTSKKYVHKIIKKLHAVYKEKNILKDKIKQYNFKIRYYQREHHLKPDTMEWLTITTSKKKR